MATKIGQVKKKIFGHVRLYVWKKSRYLFYFNKIGKLIKSRFIDNFDKKWYTTLNSSS